MTQQDLVAALRNKARFVSLSEYGFHGPPDVGGGRYLFVGAQGAWDQIRSCCAVISLPDEDTAELERRAVEFHELVRALRPYAISLAPETRLAAFGLLVVLAEKPCSADFAQQVASQKRGSFWGRDYAVTWLVDAAGRSVTTHSGMPLKADPGRRFFVELLSPAGH
jgi:hypothetical protein